jgi:hypothetical protein
LHQEPDLQRPVAAGHRADELRESSEAARRIAAADEPPADVDGDELPVDGDASDRLAVGDIRADLTRCLSRRRACHELTNGVRDRRARPGHARQLLALQEEDRDAGLRLRTGARGDGDEPDESRDDRDAPQHHGSSRVSPRL